MLLAISRPLHAGCVPLHGNRALGAPDVHKAIWQVITPPSSPVGRKTKALLFNLSMPMRTGVTPADSQVSRTLSLCRSQLLLTQHRSSPHPEKLAAVQVLSSLSLYCATPEWQAKVISSWTQHNIAIRICFPASTALI